MRNNKKSLGKSLSKIIFALVILLLVGLLGIAIIYYKIILPKDNQEDLANKDDRVEYFAYIKNNEIIYSDSNGKSTKLSNNLESKSIDLEKVKTSPNKSFIAYLINDSNGEELTELYVKGLDAKNKFEYVASDVDEFNFSEDSNYLIVKTNPSRLIIYNIKKIKQKIFHII